MSKTIAPDSGRSLPPTFPERERVLMTSSCRDCDDIPKVKDAGSIFDSPLGQYQLMHNGVKVLHGGYHGLWMAEIIRRLNGHHEPQEELVFHEVLKHISKGASMLELGGFWSFYSLWFQQSIDKAANYILEPDPHNLEVGQTNFRLNQRKAHFAQLAVSNASGTIDLKCTSDWVVRKVKQTSIDDFVSNSGIESIDLLHADIQGFELEMLEGMRELIAGRKVRFVFISTHHHSISKDPLTHQKCRKFLIDAGAYLIADHTVAESFSGDGLLVGSFDHRDAQISVPISYNRASRSLFPEVEYDLAAAWNETASLKAKSHSTFRPLRKLLAPLKRAS
jgi:FkbM family methyltransferase